MRVEVLLNAAAGLKPGVVRYEADRVGELFARRGVDARVREVPGADLAACATEASRSGVDAVVVGGGDGTVSAGAGAMVNAPQPMGVLPFGTLNHFARDAGIPLGLEGAVDTIASGRVVQVDVGDANGRIFVNNSSLGLYPEAVAGRDAQRAFGSANKWVAMVRAGVATLRRFPVVRLTLRIPDGEVLVTTPVVLIGNNRYEMKRPGLGRRTALDRGELWVYLARSNGRLAFVRLALRAVVGRLDESRDLQGLGLRELLLDDRRRSLRIAFDGEVCQVAPPILYRIRPRALRVLVPAEGPAGPPGAAAGTP
jgi:diacylglycerol kinase family enzyme